MNDGPWDDDGFGFPDAGALVDGYVVPEDPMNLLNCDSCQ